MKLSFLIIATLILSSFGLQAQNCPAGYEKVREVVVSCKPINYTRQGIPGGGGGVEGLFKTYEYILANIGDDQFNALLNQAPDDLKSNMEFFNSFRIEGNSLSNSFEIKEYNQPIGQFQNIDFSQYSDILKNFNTKIGQMENNQKLLKKNNQLIKQLEKTQFQEIK